ncbi:uncharacterized protein BO80DRAFT_135434 [Aspergillus ibericus CBS 121593]|uniref:Uncharacterized protein n=1 Tax=Aspergillus ibericus CBS 121593 TaxID=1448316 RepID=A0A395HE21_9EURO|nr:hypothetical protein BO80DRAFT_135434 [Aspergillus ibericus CBS 121593]RAL05355.1 hypothetical protein BO80DRAFT_135434 [Aspergillus ibericus CBS 121593]
MTFTMTIPIMPTTTTTTTTRPPRTTLPRSQRSFDTDIATLEAMISELGSNPVPTFPSGRERSGRRGSRRDVERTCISTSAGTSASARGCGDGSGGYSYSYSYSCSESESESESESASQESVEWRFSDEDRCEGLGMEWRKGRGDGV